MKTALVFAFMTLVSSVSFAAGSDVYVFNTLKALGAVEMEEHGQLQISLADVKCEIGGHGPDILCSFHDNFADPLHGKKKEFNNNSQAEMLAELLNDLNVADELENGMMVQTLTAIHCMQSIHDTGSSIEDRTECEVEHKNEPLLNCFEPQDGFERLFCSNVIDIYNVETINCLDDYSQHEHTCENVKNPDTGKIFSCLGDVDNNVQVKLCQSVPDPATVRIVDCLGPIDETSEHDVWMCTKVHKANQSYMHRRLYK